MLYFENRNYSHTTVADREHALYTGQNGPSRQRWRPPNGHTAHALFVPCSLPIAPVVNRSGETIAPGAAAVVLRAPRRASAPTLRRVRALGSQDGMRAVALAGGHRLRRGDILRFGPRRGAWSVPVGGPTCPSPVDGSNAVALRGAKWPSGDLPVVGGNVRSRSAS